MSFDLRQLTLFQRLALAGVGLILLVSTFVAWSLSDALENELTAVPSFQGTSSAPALEVLEAQKRSVWVRVFSGALVLSAAFIGFVFVVVRSYERQIGEMEDMSLQLVTSMVNAVDAQSVSKRGHSERTTRYALRIGRKMGLEGDALDDLRFASLLHDVGCVGQHGNVADEKAELTDEERDVIQQQPGRGEEILREVSRFRRLLPVMRSHRERYDGTGYPDAQGGDAIPLLARIVHVAEAYDAMLEERPYRAGSGPKYAREELIRHSGTQFDPKVVDIFLKILAAEEKRKA